MRPLPRLHLVTDDDILSRTDFLGSARSVLKTGGRELALHLRGPRTDGRRHYELAERLRDAADAAGGLLVANDRVDVALALALPAVQLGARSLPLTDARGLVGPSVLLGASVHGLGEAREAVGRGADFLILGTVYATPSHPEREGAGPELVRAVAAAVASTPVLGIGGVTPERMPEIVRAGGHGAAVLRGVWHAGDPSNAVERYLEALPAESKRPLDGMSNAP